MTSPPPGSPERWVAMLAALAPFLLVMGVFFARYEAYEPLGASLLSGGDFSCDSAGSSLTDCLPRGGAWNKPGALVAWEESGGVDGSPGLRLDAGPPAGGVVQAEMGDLREFPYLRISARVRTDSVKLGERPWNAARLLLFFKDDKGLSRWENPHTACLLTGTHGWSRCEATIPVPPSGATAFVFAANGGASGTMWVDDLALTPMRRKAALSTWRTLFAAGWALCLLIPAWAVRIWRRPLGFAIAATVVLIVVGTSVPQRALVTATDASVEVAQSLERAVNGTRTATQTPPAGPHSTTAPATTGTPAAPTAKPPPAVVPPPQSPPSPPPSRTAPVTVEWIKKPAHFFLFTLLGLLSALSLRRSPAVTTARTLALVVAGLLLFAAGTEVLQFVTDSRRPTPVDWSIDAAGVALGVIVSRWSLLHFSHPEGRDAEAVR